MSVFKMALAAAGLAVAFAADAAPSRPSVITQPDWVAKPDGETLANAYPPIATQLDIEGRATISCTVDEFGKLQNCAATDEAPSGMGFGIAAVSMAGAFAMRPLTRDGQPVSGGTVRIPIRFVLPAMPPAFAPPPPTSAHALEVAWKFVQLVTASDAAAEGYEKAARELDFLDRPGMPADTRTALAAALRASYPARLKESADRQAALYAGIFTDAQLEQILAFFSTPAGVAVSAENDEIRAVQTMIERDGKRIGMKAAQEAFCATHDCVGKDDALALARDVSGPKPAVTIPAPTWAQQPTDDQVWAARPPLAKVLEMAGSVRLTCTVASRGELNNCAVAGEAPTGLGFGAAGRSLAAYYRLSPSLLAAGAAGETVAVRVHFDAEGPDDDESYAGLPPRSPHALALARELLAASDPGLASAAAARKARTDNLPRGISKAERDAVIDAFEESVKAARLRTQELQAAYMTTRLTDAQMVAATQFWRSPVGAALKTRNGELEVGTHQIGFETQQRIWADTGRAFCRNRDCPATAQASPPGSGPASGPSAAPSPRTP